MSKKKPVDAEFSAPPAAEAPAAAPETEEPQARAAQSDELERLSRAALAAEKESAGLKDKLAEYVAELDALRKKVVELEKRPSVAELEKEVKSLREENDKYLMRISELSFDNARLTASLDRATKAQRQPSSMTPGSAGRQAPGGAPTSTYGGARRNHAVDINGYTTWN